MNTLRWALDRLTLYLPVLLMGALAMASYLLVRSTPSQSEVVAAAVAQHQPDYFMREFAVKTFDAQGQLKSEVKGREMRHYPDTDTLEIDQVVIRSFDEQGHLTTATARQALTNADASEVTLIGDARVLRAATVTPAGKPQPAMSFQGEQLHALVDTERVRSDQPVTLTRGQDQFTADSMDYDNQQQVIEMQGRVRGVLFPGNKP
ncbi:LPS export ABC transporter periplasmic protein LptC [Rhodoferax antarcticus]|uniref:LPS export ABC transporter periplasmic protein LptC n=1 Tax=Rhodoferax antarcticus TaxID=81479 RepID=UPI002224DAF9|nr:LPS export ABC transporter periplasmic protein LptC [Rhodoferax antarcticus]MCW2313425.1 lipopolysaccharide export system protein LptC [Rhodoferax antarcticus]